MMSGIPLETRSAFNKFWNNKFYYKFASFWLFILIQMILCTHILGTHIIRQHTEYFTHRCN
jgi:hypothetical protein